MASPRTLPVTLSVPDLSLEPRTADPPAPSIRRVLSDCCLVHSDSGPAAPVGRVYPSAARRFMARSVAFAAVASVGVCGRSSRPGSRSSLSGSFASSSRSSPLNPYPQHCFDVAAEVQRQRTDALGREGTLPHHRSAEAWAERNARRRARFDEARAAVLRRRFEQQRMELSRQCFAERFLVQKEALHSLTALGAECHRLAVRSATASSPSKAFSPSGDRQRVMSAAACAAVTSPLSCQEVVVPVSRVSIALHHAATDLKEVLSFRRHFLTHVRNLLNESGRRMFDDLTAALSSFTAPSPTLDASPGDSDDHAEAFVMSSSAVCFACIDLLRLHHGQPTLGELHQTVHLLGNHVLKGCESVLMDGDAHLTVSAVRVLDILRASVALPGGTSDPAMKLNQIAGRVFVSAFYMDIQRLVRHAAGVTTGRGTDSTSAPERHSAERHAAVCASDFVDLLSSTKLRHSTDDVAPALLRSFRMFHAAFDASRAEAKETCIASLLDTFVGLHQSKRAMQARASSLQPRDGLPLPEVPTASETARRTSAAAVLRRQKAADLASAVDAQIAKVLLRIRGIGGQAAVARAMERVASL
jgi:hypothetical protein